MTQEFHNEKEPDRATNPDEVVASGAAVQAATSAKSHRVKRRFRTQCERAKPTVPLTLLALPQARAKERCLCDSSTDTRNVHDVSHVCFSARSLIAQNMIQGLFNEKEFNPEASTGGTDKRNAHEAQRA